MFLYLIGLVALGGRNETMISPECFLWPGVLDDQCVYDERGERQAGPGHGQVPDGDCLQPSNTHSSSSQHQLTSVTVEQIQQFRWLNKHITISFTGHYLISPVSLKLKRCVMGGCRLVSCQCSSAVVLGLLVLTLEKLTDCVVMLRIECEC